LFGTRKGFRESDLDGWIEERKIRDTSYRNILSVANLFVIVVGCDIVDLAKDDIPVVVVGFLSGEVVDGDAACGR
jgi:uncharacterized membrane protein YqgA involved in biofilm formation